MALVYSSDDAVASTAYSALALNTRFNDIKAKFNGGIINEDISASANIAVSKLSASKEHMLVNLKFKGTWPAANTVVDVIPVINDSKGSWTIDGANLTCSDVGDDNAQLRIEWGRYVAGVWTVTSTPVSAVAINSDDSAGNTAGQQTLTLASSTIALGAHRGLALVSAAAGTNTLSAATDFISVTLQLSRAIST